MPSIVPADHSGRLLEGKYRLQRSLGKGGMGEVYEAYHELIGRKVAVKVLHSEYLADEGAVRRFEQEARTATAIGHEHIVEITDMGRLEHGELFIAMEFLEGLDLAGVLQLEPRLEPRRVCHIAIQILSALEATHAKGIVHRDLKPANIILVPRDGTQDYVKIVDFGISKVGDPSGGSAPSNTRAGELLGTPLYMSPEQALGSLDITWSTDIFSVGVMMYEMLGGALPFQAPSLPRLLHRIIREDPEPLGQLNPEVPDELCQIVANAMAKRPMDRFRSAAEMRRALRKFSPETSLVAGLRTTRISSRIALMQETLRGGKAVPSKGAMARRRGLGFAILGTAVACGLALGLGWLRAHNPQPKAEPMASLAAPASRVFRNALAARATGAAALKPMPEPRVSRTGELTVEVTPFDAEIIVDDVTIGQGSKEGFPIPLDHRTHSILVRRKGYAQYMRSLSFNSNLYLRVALDPLPGARVEGKAAETRMRAAPAAGEKDSTKNGAHRHRRIIDENSPW
ncbi:MAG: serine/threonine protein kinase [Myxococcota bacterium]|jgi:tRNA A-37 threonylcarbamoyl transferase component Bud32|nr:serine/threonine protein kinase [Myxococcota bacterium]